MNNKIETYTQLWSLVELENERNEITSIAKKFLEGMYDWPSMNMELISEYSKKLKKYFGEPLTIEKLKSKNVDEGNLWQMESSSSIIEMFELAKNNLNETDFDTILSRIIKYYEIEYSNVDFVAELKYKTSEEGGRHTPAFSKYRPHIKFDFDEMQTSGEQIFIDKHEVNPGDMVNAKIKILAVDHFAGRLNEEMDFEFREGSSVIGTGKILVIINDKLKNASK